MARDGIEIDISGLEEVERTLSRLAPNSARNILRNTTTDIARELRDEARSNAPVDEGTLRKAIKSRRRRGDTDEAAAALYITQGKSEKYDAWYWTFVEWGTVKKQSQHFLLPAMMTIMAAMDELLGRYFIRRYDKEIERLARKKAKGKS